MPTPVRRENGQFNGSVGSGSKHTPASPPVPAPATTTGAASSVPPVTVPVVGSDHRTWHLTPGVLDDAAREAFTEGQCHAFAQAMHERTGWPLVAALDEDCCYDADMDCADIRLPSGDIVCTCQFNHVLTETPDGQLLDINGLHTEEDLDDELSYGEQQWVRGPDVTAIIDRLIQRGEMREAALPLARTFIDPVLTEHHLHAEG